MSAFKDQSNAAYFKIQFLWLCRRSIYRTLSFNISREVCDYFGYYFGFQSTFVPVILQDTLRLYDLKARSVLVKKVAITATAGMVFCYTMRNSVLCIGGLKRKKAVLELRAPLYHAETIGEMNSTRESPGVYCSYLAVYVFGGDSPIFMSCEKMMFATNQISAMGEMSVGRSCFTPCYYQDELYLVDAWAQSKSFEAFTLRTESFRPLRLELPSYFMCNSITLESNGDFLVLLNTGEVVRLNGSSEEVIIKQKLHLHGLLAVSLCPPVAFNGSFFFCNEKKGSLVRFDVNKKTLSRELFIEIVKK